MAADQDDKRDIDDFRSLVALIVIKKTSTSFEASLSLSPHVYAL